MTAETALAGACGGVVGKARIKQEIIQGTLDLALDQLIIAAALPDAIFGLRKREDGAVPILDPRAVDIVRPGVCQRVRDRLLLVRKAASCAAHHPLVALVSRVQIGDRAPAHGTVYRVTLIHDGTDLLQIRGVELAVAGGAHQGGLGSAAAHAEGKDALCISGHTIITEAEKTYRSLQICHAGWCTCVTSAAARMDIDKARICVADNASGIVRECRHRGIARRVDGHDDGGCGGGIPVQGGIRQRAAPCPVAVVAAVEISAGYKYGERLVTLIRRGCTVGYTDLVIHIVVRVVVPFCHVDCGKC